MHHASVYNTVSTMGHGLKLRMHIIGFLSDMLIFSNPLQ